MRNQDPRTVYKPRGIVTGLLTREDGTVVSVRILKISGDLVQVTPSLKRDGTWKEWLPSMFVKPR